MSKEIDWAQLAAQLGLLKPNGESSGSNQAREALELIIGADTLRASVDHYVACGRGAELARSVLWILHPWSAMSRCYEIYKSDASINRRRTAVELLRVVADRRALPWIPEFLNDPDADVQSWGAGVLDQLLFSELVDPEDVEDLIKAAEQHPNQLVRERADFIRRHLKNDENRDGQNRSE